MNPYRFENQNREIVLSRYNMPTPWMNYLSNGTLHAMISQAGGGVAWYKSPQIWRINHYFSTAFSDRRAHCVQRSRAICAPLGHSAG